MEQQEPRKTFVKNIHEFCKPIQLNEIFMEELKQHSNWEYFDGVMKFENEMEKKIFIFLEFTRERSTCNEMIDILRKSGQELAANQLQEYNTSPSFMEITNEIELPVIPATVKRSGESKWFVMNERPRGKCIIINNVKNELYKESLRFRNIFEQLYFDVEECYDMSAKAMKDSLKELANEERLKKDNALVVMIISHGHDEQVVGIDGEDLRLSTIVDIFSETNCANMRRKPKLFFFNCCRIKKDEYKVIARAVSKVNKIYFELETVAQNWINTNKYTLICFACAEADRSWFTPNQFTFFGQALSHCIAQYACDKSVQQIMNLTCERAQMSPEIRLCKMTRDLYLNPGIPIDPNKQFHQSKQNKIFEATNYQSKPEESKPKEFKPEECIQENSKLEKSESEKSKSEKNAEMVNVLRTAQMKFIEKNLKGMCIIINNVKNLLQKESLIFKNIFELLKFDVELCYDMSANEIEEKLKSFSVENFFEEDLSLIVMIISHGHEEQVVGTDGEELKISTIVDIFSETNFIRKFFFFNCCRNNSQELSVARTQPLSNKIDFKLESVDQNGINTNKCTLVCYAFAEAYKYWLIQNEYTYFGKTLSENEHYCIVHDSCDKRVQQIMNLICEKTEQLLYENLEECQVLPRIRLCKMTRDIIFNCGLTHDENSSSTSCHVSENTNEPSTSKANFQIDKKINMDANELNYESKPQSRNHISSDPEVKAKVNKDFQYYEQKRNDYSTQYELYKYLYGNKSNEKISNIKELGTFNKEIKINEGSFGAVFEIMDPKDNQCYALKKINLKSVDDKRKEYLMREVQINIRLRSEFVVNYVDSYFYKEFYIIKMELCYCDLDRLIEIKREEFNRNKLKHMDKIEFYITCELFEEILDCVDYLHTKSIIHRDIKPDNFLITENGTNGRFVKIGDFGLSKEHELKNKSMKHSTGVGNVRYNSPEAENGRKYGLKSDCYSLGITMSELFEFEVDMLRRTEEKLLQDRYIEMKELCRQLVSECVALRPSCKNSKILMQTWALKLNDLNKEIEFIKLKKDISNDITIEESFHKFFIQKKLKYF